MNINKKIKSHILSQTVDKNDRKIGIEVECFIFTKNFKRIPVNSLNNYSAIDLLNELNDTSKKTNGVYSIEPGGQIEWSSPPFSNIRNLEKSLYNHKKLIDGVLKKRDLIPLYMGVDPFHGPDSIDLIENKK